MLTDVTKILYIRYDANKKEVSVIIEDNQLLLIPQHIKQVLDSMCLMHGSDMQGRLVFFSKVQKIRKKVPLLISEKHEVIVFPIHHQRSKQQLWIAYQPIKYIVAVDNVSSIVFKDGTNLQVSLSTRNIKRQMVRYKTMIKFLREV